MTTDLTSVQVIVYGRVQGVYFRAFTSRHANQLGLTGYVRNVTGGIAVEVQAEGKRAKLEELIDSLRKGPIGAKVERVETDWAEYTGSYPDFSVRY